MECKDRKSTGSKALKEKKRDERVHIKKGRTKKQETEDGQEEKSKSKCESTWSSVGPLRLGDEL
jgi:hypothetical protein